MAKKKNTRKKAIRKVVKKSTPRKAVKKKKAAPRKKAARKKTPNKPKPAKRSASKSFEVNPSPPPPRATRSVTLPEAAGDAPPPTDEVIECGNFILVPSGEWWFCMEKCDDGSQKEHDRFKTKQRAMKHFQNEHSE
jgi:hypothetical protein